MSEEPTTFQVSTKYVLTPKQGEPSLAVSRSDWRFLEEMVEGIPGPSTLYRDLAAFCCGVAASAIVAALTTEQGVASWVVFVVAVAFGGGLTLASHERHKATSRTRQDVLKEMGRLEEKYVLEPRPPTTRTHMTYSKVPHHTDMTGAVITSTRQDNPTSR